MIKVLNSTHNPIQFIGQVAGICYNSSNTEVANYKRGIKCIEENHGRVMEFIDVTIEIDGYSARCIRELGRHIIGTSYLQASTRYINYDNFDYYTPDAISDNESYHKAMRDMLEVYNNLIATGVAKEDVANLLPLGMTSKVVFKMNYRALLHLAEVRLCSRAYKEIQDLVNEMIEVIGLCDPEWKELMSYMKPRCKTCTEKHNCKRRKDNE